MITILPAGENEIQVIQSLAYRIWPQTFKAILSKDQLDYMLELMYSTASLKLQIEKKHQFVIARQDNEPIGFAAYYQKEGKVPVIFKLDKIYVLPDRHGKGIGKQIIEHIISITKENNAATLELNVNRDNPAVSFYEKLGFKIMSEEDIPIGGGYFMNDFIMRLIY